jgi:hypothetical protein
VKLAELTIASRFRGPTGSGNGGYVAGALAAFSALESPAVRLLRPPPLDVPLDVVVPEVDAVADTLELRDAAGMVAMLSDGTLGFLPPPAPSADEASAGRTRYAGSRSHPFPGCFVCGPERDAGDGLRIYAGPPDPADPHRVSAPWVPDESLAGTRGRVRPEFLWAALDCPGYFAVAPDGRTMLLGALTVRLYAPLDVGRPCVIAGWRIGATGRRHQAGTALYADGECVAAGLATWVEVRPPG